jgi:esterase/lipase superfamily enzyme
LPAAEFPARNEGALCGLADGPSQPGGFEMLVFGGYHDENIYFNSPCGYLPHLPDTWRFNPMRIILEQRRLE